MSLALQMIVYEPDARGQLPVPSWVPASAPLHAAAVPQQAPPPQALPSAATAIPAAGAPYWIDTLFDPTSPSRRHCQCAGGMVSLRAHDFLRTAQCGGQILRLGHVEWTTQMRIHLNFPKCRPLVKALV